MKGNIQHLTSILERRRSARCFLVGRWGLNVQCSMFFLAVISLIAALPLQGQTINLPELSPPYGELPVTFWDRHGPFTVVFGLALTLMIVVNLWLFFPRKLKKIISPEVEVRQALQQLSQQPEDGIVLSRVSRVVRNYFCVAFRLAPGELTTAEFSRELSHCKGVNPELATTAVEFLKDCDARKFAPAVSPEKPAAAHRALKLIELAEQRRNQRRPPVLPQPRSPRA